MYYANYCGDLCSAVKALIPSVFFPQNQDSVNTDTVCRLYEVGRQRLAEEEEEDEEDQVKDHTQFSLFGQSSAFVILYSSL